MNKEGFEQALWGNSKKFPRKLETDGATLTFSSGGIKRRQKTPTLHGSIVPAIYGNGYPECAATLLVKMPSGDSNRSAISVFPQAGCCAMNFALGVHIKSKCEFIVG